MFHCMGLILQWVYEMDYNEFHDAICEHVNTNTVDSIQVKKDEDGSLKISVIIWFLRSERATPKAIHGTSYEEVLEKVKKTIRKG